MVANVQDSGELADDASSKQTISSTYIGLTTAAGTSHPCWGSMWAFSCGNGNSFLDGRCSHPEGDVSKTSDSARVILSDPDSFSHLGGTSSYCRELILISTVVIALHPLTDTLIFGGYPSDGFPYFGGYVLENWG